VHAGDRVLDVATGRGAVLFAATERAGERGRVIGVDLAEEMVALTSADIQARRITNAEVRVADAERLSEFIDGEFGATALVARASARAMPATGLIDRGHARPRSEAPHAG